MDVSRGDVLYYVSGQLEKSGNTNSHYHLVLGDFTSPSGREYYYIIATSQEIENRPQNENVLIIKPEECSVFYKMTRFNCDWVFHEKLPKSVPCRGQMPVCFIEEVLKKISCSRYVKDVIKKRLGVYKRKSKTSEIKTASSRSTYKIKKTHPSNNYLGAHSYELLI